MIASSAILHSMNPEHPDAVEQSRDGRSVPLRGTSTFALEGPANAVAMQALRETRLRGLSAAEEYRVVSDRLYRSGVRDLPPGLLVNWIEEQVAEQYESFLELRALGDRLSMAIARDDLATAAWELICALPSDARSRLSDGIRRLNDLNERGL